MPCAEVMLRDHINDACHPSFWEFKILSVCLSRVRSPELNSSIAAESESHLAE